MSATAEITNTQRLALGVKPIDVLTSRLSNIPVRIEIESGVPHSSTMSDNNKFGYHRRMGQRPRGLLRHPSGRYSLQYSDFVPSEVVLRVYDFKRHFVPRRLRLPLISLSEVLAREASSASDQLADRSCRIALFPGAAYPVSGMIGLKGRVMQSGSPVRWAIIEGEVEGSEVILRARCDDRGEFILIFPSAAVSDSELPSEIRVQFTAFAPVVTVPVSTKIQRADPYWDIPVEEAGNVSSGDPVLSGLTIPPDYVESTGTTILTLPVDRLSFSRDVGAVEFTT